MRNLRKHTMVLGVVAIFMAVTSVSLAIVAGRDYSRCIQSCNTADQVCKAACVDDCKALCNNVTSCTNPCVTNCKSTTCVPTMDECKAMCKSIKNGGSPTEP